MYFFIPPRFRAKPICMVSHSWSTWLRQICFFPAKTGLAGARAGAGVVTAASAGGHEGEGGDGTTAIWIDIFAMPMAVYYPAADKVGFEGERRLCELTTSVAKRVKTTFVVLPGEVRSAGAPS